MKRMEKPRLQEIYESQIRGDLKQALGVKNVMQVPRLKKIVINVGVTGSIADNKLVAHVENAVTKISGQKPVRALSKKSIAGFKLRENLPIGVLVTLRKQRMYDFLDKLIHVALPKVRDFQGISPRFDGRGNYNLGIKEWIIFPEMEQSFGEKIFGMNVTIETSAETDAHGYELLKRFGMPFRARTK